MKQLIKRVKQISMLLLAISFFGCENNDDDNYPEVLAGFTYTINVDTGTVTFINTSVNSRNYFWTFGDGTSSTEINPIKTFTRGEYLVTLKATNVAGGSDTYEDTIVISDVGAPIITLLGETTMNIKIGGTFTDPGATAMDDVDGNITANIVVGGDVVNVNTAGTYIITYNVSDAAGNAATQKTRTVIVTAGPVASGAYLYATSGTVTIASTFADWGTGTTINPNYTGNATYNPSIQLISGTGWGPVSAVAFTAIAAGTISKYSTLEFKIKTTDYTTVKVKVPEVEKSFTLASGTALAGGWIQMSIPLSTFGAAAVNSAVEFAIFEFGAGTMLITDVMLSGDGGVVPPSNCPAPPAGELLSNGGFEAGNVCWQFFAGTSVSSTIFKDGSKSAEIQGSTGAATGIKMERFAVGSILPNTSYTVSFDIIASGAFGEGGLMKAFTFSEGADGGSVPATQHVLTDNTTSIATTWERKTYTFTTPGNANQVAGGLSFLIEIVNSAVKLHVDNVVVKKTN